MTVTASFIDDSWRLHKKVIGFFMVKGHKGDDIGKNVMGFREGNDYYSRQCKCK
jgi:hypothetical protein